MIWNKIKMKEKIIMNDNKQAPVYSGGISFFGLLGIVFIILKLTGYINWSWWYVLAPIWIPFAFSLGVIIILLIFFSIMVKIKK